MPCLLRYSRPVGLFREKWALTHSSHGGLNDKCHCHLIRLLCLRGYRRCWDHRLLGEVTGELIRKRKFQILSGAIECPRGRYCGPSVIPKTLAQDRRDTPCQITTVPTLVEQTQLVAPPRRFCPYAVCVNSGSRGVFSNGIKLSIRRFPASAPPDSIIFIRSPRARTCIR